MFLGHYGVAFAAKRVVPSTCLGWLLAATAALDLIWPLFLLLGLEHVRIAPGDTTVTPLDFYDYPLTHSLVAALGSSVLVAAVYYGVRRDRRGGVVIGALVLSHWVLDAIAHRPDLPLYPGGPLIGLGLWNSLPATLAVEALVFGAGILAYSRATIPRDRIGKYALWSFVAFFSLIYVGNVFGPPPPNVKAIGWLGLAQWLIVPWGWWMDAHRTTARN
jgi:hypothetical protein